MNASSKRVVEPSAFARCYSPAAVGNLDGVERTPPHDRALLRALDAQKKMTNTQKGDDVCEQAYRTLFVGRLTLKTTSELLARAFDRFGSVEDAVRRVYGVRLRL